MINESLIPRNNVTKNPESATTDAQTTSVDGKTDTSATQNTDTSIDSNAIDWEKRYKDMQSFSSKRENELNKTIEDLKTSEQSFKLPTSPEDMEAFKKKDTEMYNMMVSLAHQQAANANQGLNATVETLEAERTSANLTKMRDKIQAAHTDYLDIVNSEDWTKWSDGQPQEVQKWVHENYDNPDLAIIALDRYKAQRDANQAHLDQRKRVKDNTASAAQGVAPSSAPQQSGQPRIYTATEIKAMSSKQWAECEDDITLGVTQGRVFLNQ